MYVCMYVSMCLCMYVCMYVCIYVCIYVCMPVCIRVLNRVCVYTRNTGSHVEEYSLQCPTNEQCKCEMFNEIQNISNEMREKFSKLRGEENFLSLMGRNMTTVSPEDMLSMWTKTCSYISYMYQRAIRNRER